MTNLIIESTMKNHLKLFDEHGDPDVEKTAKFLEISMAQLAECFGLTSEQIRPGRMSDLAKNIIRELAGTLGFVADIFKGNVKKTVFWMKTPNPHFGGVSPRDLIIRGRYKKVHGFVQAAVSRQRESA